MISDLQSENKNMKSGFDSLQEKNKNQLNTIGLLQKTMDNQQLTIQRSELKIAKLEEAIDKILQTTIKKEVQK